MYSWGWVGNVNVDKLGKRHILRFSKKLLTFFPQLGPLAVKWTCTHRPWPVPSPQKLACPKLSSPSKLLFLPAEATLLHHQIFEGQNANQPDSGLCFQQTLFILAQHQIKGPSVAGPPLSRLLHRALFRP